MRTLAAGRPPRRDTGILRRLVRREREAAKEREAIKREAAPGASKGGNSEGSPRSRQASHGAVDTASARPPGNSLIRLALEVFGGKIEAIKRADGLWYRWPELIREVDVSEGEPADYVPRGNSGKGVPP